MATSSSEPTFLRLKRLVDTRMPEIRQRESRNERMVYLYDTGEYWTAFERSAYFLKRSRPELMTFVLATRPDRRSAVVAISVPAPLARECGSLSVRPIDLQAYERWHRAEVDALLEGMAGLAV